MPFFLPDSPTEPTIVDALMQRIATLEADNLRLRAAVIQRDSALAFARADRQALAESLPGLPRRVELARHVDVLAERVQSLLRERPRRDAASAPRQRPRLEAAP